MEPSKCPPKPVENPQFRITPIQQAAASCTGAVLTSLLVTPLDVVKIRLQAQQKHQQAMKTSNKCFLYCNGLMDHFCGCGPNTSANNQWYQRPGHFNGTIDAIVKITRNEGIGSLWSGLGPTLVLAIPATVIYFVCYEQIRQRLKDMYNKNKLPEEYVQPHWIPLVSGSSARIVSASLVSPLELIRTKMQSQRYSYLEIGKALQFLIQQSGIKGLWKGVFPTLMRDVPFSAVYWMSYEALKSLLGDDSESPTFSISFISGAVSGGLAASLTVPFDVVKTLQQIDLGEKALYTDTPKRTQTTMEIIRRIHQQHGVRGLFTGLIPRLIKVAPACAIMISSFEYGKVFFYRYNEEMSMCDERQREETIAFYEEMNCLHEPFV